MRIYREPNNIAETKHFAIERWKADSKYPYCIFYSVSNKKNYSVQIASFTNFKEAFDYAKGLELDLKEWEGEQ